MSWIDQFLTAIGFVQDAGTPLIQRPTINFVLPPGGTVVDDPNTKVTTVTIPTASASTQISAKVAATSAVTLSGSQTIDGVVVNPGDVVLVTSQPSGAENGLWVVASGAWTRTTDAIVRGMAVYIQQGTTNGGSTFTLLGSGSIIVGTSPLNFANLHDVFDIRQFGAVCDGVTDDAPAARLAMSAAKANGRGTIFFPHATIAFLTSGYSGANAAGILVDCDNIRIQGAGPGKTKILLGTGWNKAVILAQAYTIGVDISTRPINGFEVDGIRFEYTDTGPASTGTIQANTCNSPLVRNVYIKGNGTGMGGVNVDGIAFGDETTSPRCIDCTCDGLSKTGFYLPLCTDAKFTNCESKNMYGPFSSGCQVSGAFDAELVNCSFHDIQTNASGGWGLIFFVNSGASPTISTFTNQTHFVIDFGSTFTQSLYAKFLGVFNTAEMCMEALDVQSATPDGTGRFYTMVLNSAPNQTLAGGMTLVGDYQPCNRVKIVGGSIYNCAAQGITVASAITGGFVRRVHLLGVHVHDNASYGINPTSCKDWLIENCVIERNGSVGVFAADVGPNATVEGLCARLRITGGRIRDNGQAGIMLSACDDTTIDSSVEITTSDVGTYQGVGIQVQGKAVARPLTCTVTAVTNVVSTSPTSHGYTAGLGVIFDTTANGITAGALYYVIASGLTATAFKVSTTSGGSELDITSDGTNTVRRWKKCTDPKIGRFTDTGYSNTQIYHPNGTADAPDEGHYRHFSHTGSPDSGYYAPPGSLVPDLAGGQYYVKQSAGIEITGWERLVQDGDGDAANTSSKWVIRDANSDVFAYRVHVAGSLPGVYSTTGIIASCASGNFSITDGALSTWFGVGSTQITNNIDLLENPNGVTFSVGFSSRFKIDATGFGAFGHATSAQQTMGAATAGAVYTAAEQAMLQKVWDVLRAYGWGT